MEVVPDGVCPLEVESCLALVRVVGLLSVVNSRQVSAIELGESIARHLALHKRAYGVEAWVPKFHW
eukprot:3683308-Pyramimonas_sp.AAC.1